MSVSIQAVIIDAADPGRLAAFWQEALGWRRTFENEEEVVLEPAEHSIEDGVVADLLISRGLVEKAGKNRLHLDLRPSAEPGQDAEVARLLALGATHADVGQPGDVSWAVLADPEGNEFCVLSPFSPEQEAQLAAIRAARRP
jgi:hypothetical protein